MKCKVEVTLEKEACYSQIESVTDQVGLRRDELIPLITLPVFQRIVSCVLEF